MCLSHFGLPPSYAGPSYLGPVSFMGDAGAQLHDTAADRLMFRRLADNGVLARSVVWYLATVLIPTLLLILVVLLLAPTPWPALNFLLPLLGGGATIATGYRTLTRDTNPGQTYDIRTMSDDALAAELHARQASAGQKLGAWYGPQPGPLQDLQHEPPHEQSRVGR